MYFDESSVSAEEVTVCCLHSDDCTYVSSKEEGRELLVSWDDAWLYLSIVSNGVRKAFTLIPIEEISRVRVILFDEEEMEFNGEQLN